jgi:leucyl-tRNA synthetase
LTGIAIFAGTALDDRPFDPTLTAKWLPVDMYIGGPEHSVLHLMYSRFITMALHDLEDTSALRNRLLIFERTDSCAKTAQK